MRAFIARLAQPNGLLGVVLGVHLVLGGIYVWATPVLEAPDEGYHVAVIRYLTQTASLPVQRPDVTTDWEQEGSQPPLYYALVAGVTFWVDTDDWETVYVRNPFLKHIPGTPHNVNFFRHGVGQALAGTQLLVLLGRGISLLLSVGTLWFTYQLALQVFPGRQTLALFTVALVAFNPKALFINASVNNDNLLMLLSTAALWLIIRIAQTTAIGGYREYIYLGLLLGAAALTKLSGLVLWPIAGLSLVWAAWGKRDLRQLLVSSALVFGLACGVAGWWFWRNWQLYGDWLGLDTMVAIAHPRHPPIGLWELIETEWRGFFLSYWSVFGVFTVLPAEWVHTFFDLLTVVALVGATWHLLRHPPRLRADVVLLLLFCLATLAGVVRWTLQTPASQGRLLFGAIAPLALFMAWGLLPRPWAQATTQLGSSSPLFRIWPVALSGALALIATFIPLAYIAPRYAPPTPLTEADLPADLRPLHVVFNEAIDLIGYTTRDEPHAPGGMQSVTLYWRALKPVDQDYVLALKLFGGNFAQVGSLDTWPGGGLAPTSQWQPGMIFADTYQLAIAPSATPPSLIRLSLSFWQNPSQELLWAEDGDGNELRVVTFPVGRVVPAQTPTVGPSFAVSNAFEYGIQLLGIDARVERQLLLNFYWQTSAPVPADYTLFLYVIDAQGGDVVQADAPPLAGDWPTSAWVPGLPFVDERRIDLPADLPLGTYGLRFGWYDPESGVRLSAWQPNGNPWPDNAVILPGVFEVR